MANEQPWHCVKHNREGVRGSSCYLCHQEKCDIETGSGPLNVITRALVDHMEKHGKGIIALNGILHFADLPADNELEAIRAIRRICNGESAQWTPD